MAPQAPFPLQRATTLTVNMVTKPTSVGSITAVVTTNSKTSGAPVQVARILPSVTLNTNTLASNATSITINGFAFDSTFANNSVTFNNGAVGTVTAATATTLTVRIDTPPTSLGNLTATVTTNSVSSGTAVQVATVRPVVTSSSTVKVATYPLSLSLVLVSIQTLQTIQ